MPSISLALTKCDSFVIHRSISLSQTCQILNNAKTQFQIYRREHKAHDAVNVFTIAHRPERQFEFSIWVWEFNQTGIFNERNANWGFNSREMDGFCFGFSRRLRIQHWHRMRLFMMQSVNWKCRDFTIQSHPFDYDAKRLKHDLEWLKGNNDTCFLYFIILLTTVFTVFLQPVSAPCLLQICNSGLFFLHTSSEFLRSNCAWMCVLCHFT